jgi:hypothetical protein
MPESLFNFQIALKGINKLTNHDFFCQEYFMSINIYQGSGLKKPRKLTMVDQAQ